MLKEAFLALLPRGRGWGSMREAGSLPQCPLQRLLCPESSVSPPAGCPPTLMMPWDAIFQVCLSGPHVLLGWLQLEFLSWKIAQNRKVIVLSKAVSHGSQRCMWGQRAQCTLTGKQGHFPSSAYEHQWWAGECFLLQGTQNGSYNGFKKNYTWNRWCYLRNLF